MNSQAYGTRSTQVCSCVWDRTHGQGIDVDDHEVEGHREGHGGYKPEIAPGRHTHQGLVFRQAEGK